MRVVVDTNIVFSAILNTDSAIAKILLKQKSKLNFYSVDFLFSEIEEHHEKLRKISGYSNFDLNKVIRLITTKIRFIDTNLIPNKILLESLYLTEDVDIDDTEFVALTNHIFGKLWSGDKVLQSGLIAKGWNKFITTAELIKHLNQSKKL